MNSGFLGRSIVWIAILVSVGCHSSAFSKTDEFDLLIDEASEVIHVRLTSAVLMQETHEGITITCGVRYQAEIIEDFMGHSSRGDTITFRGAPMEVGSEYLIVLRAPPAAVTDVGCGEPGRDDLMLDTSYLITSGSAPAKAHAHDEKLGFVENIGDPFPDSVELHQRRYRDCGSADFLDDENNCPTVKLETIFLWEELTNYLRVILNTQETRELDTHRSE